MASIIFCTFPIAAGAATVTSPIDSGPGSLRQAIADASPGETIDFAPALSGGRILLGGSQLLVDKAVTIDASGLQDGLIIDANLGSRAFEFTSAITGTGAILRGLNIMSGQADGGGTAADGPFGANGMSGSNGGAILNAGVLTIEDSNFFSNATGAGENGGNGTSANSEEGLGGIGGSGGAGGAIFNSGTLTIRSSSFTENFTGPGGRGGDGGTQGGAGGSAGAGGAICNSGSLTVIGSTFSQNATGSGGVGGTGGEFSGRGGSGGHGGGIVNMDSASMEIESSNISQNSIGPGGRGGSASWDGAGRGGGSGSGGGISNAGTLVLRDSSVDNNIAGTTGNIGSAIFYGWATYTANGGAGGGIDNQPLGILTVERSNISGNTAGSPGPNHPFSFVGGSGGSGGGIRNLGTATISDSIISVNRATDGRDVFVGDDQYPEQGGSGGNGGGVYNVSSLTLERTDISKNRAGHGGGGNPYIGGFGGRGGGITNASGVLEIRDCTITDNRSGDGGGSGTDPGSGGDGGAISCKLGSVNITNTTISRNVAGNGGYLDVGHADGYGAAGAGGGISTIDGQFIIIQSTISNNRTGIGYDREFGGGIYSENRIEILNSTISGNEAGTGGGIHAQSSEHLKLHFTTVSNNRAGRFSKRGPYGGTDPSPGTGGGIALRSDSDDTEFHHSIIAGNHSTNGPPDFSNDDPANERIITTGINLFSSLPGTEGTELASRTGVIVYAADSLAPLANYGGPTATMPPLSGSPAIDPAGAPSDAGDITDDQRQLPRAINGLVDIGAVESQGNPRLLVDADAPDGGDGSSWSTPFRSLQEALAVAAADPAGVREIWIAEGVYTPAGAGSPTESFVMLPSVAIFGGFRGDETRRSQRDPESHPTVLSGDLGGDDLNSDLNGIAEHFTDIVGLNSYHVVDATYGNTGSILDGLTITAGDAAGTILASLGGGVFADGSGGAALRNCRLLGNRAAGDGGAIRGYRAEFMITDCLIAGNHSGDDGGGIYAWVCETDFERCRIQGNLATDQGGGCYFADSRAKFSDCLVSGNSVPNQGGGFSVKRNTVLSISGCTIAANLAGSGGGFQCVVTPNTTPQISLHNTLIWDNATTGGGTAADSASINLADEGIAEVFVAIESCLIANENPSESGQGNLDGTRVVENDPLFIDPVAATMTGSSTGDFRVEFASPLVDAGSNAMTRSRFDLAGIPRVLSGDDGRLPTVDVGCYERPMGFVDLHLGMNPQGDADCNGIPDIIDHVVGIDDAGRPRLPVVTSDSNRGMRLVVTIRNFVPDAEIFVERSSDGQHWETLDTGLITSQLLLDGYLELSAAVTPQSSRRVIYRLKVNYLP